MRIGSPKKAIFEFRISVDMTFPGLPFSKCPRIVKHRQRADLNTSDLNIKVGIHVSPPYIKPRSFKSFERFLDTNKRLMVDRVRIMRFSLPL